MRLYTSPGNDPLVTGVILLNYYSFSETNVCFTWLQTTEQRAIMSSAGLQIHLQTHGSQSNASKHDQLTNKIALFSRHAALYIYLVLQDDERNLRVFTAVFLFLVSSCYTILSRQIQF